MKSYLDQLLEQGTISYWKQINLNPEILSEYKTDIQQENAVELSTKMFAAEITYIVNKEAVTGYLLLPNQISRPIPTIIYCRDGVGENGKIEHKDLFLTLGQFTAWGYALLASQYHEQEEMGGKDVESVTKLKEIIEEMDILDSQKIGIFGIGRGGMMAYLTLARTNFINAGVVIGGLASFFRAERLRPELKQFHDQYIGTGPDSREERSALFWPERFGEVQMLLIHGEKDQQVNYMDSVEMEDNLRFAGKNCDVEIIEGGDHTLSNHTQLRDELTRNWFDRWLK